MVTYMSVDDQEQALGFCSVYTPLMYFMIGRNQHLALWRLSDLSRFYEENQEAGRIRPFNRSPILHKHILTLDSGHGCKVERL